MLARTMGISVKNLLLTMDSSELSEHMADYAIEPWGERRSDVRNALLCSLIYNINRGKKDKQKELSDFMLYDTEIEPEENLSEKIIEAFKNWQQ